MRRDSKANEWYAVLRFTLGGREEIVDQVAVVEVVSSADIAHSEVLRLSARKDGYLYVVYRAPLYPPGESAGPT